MARGLTSGRCREKGCSWRPEWKTLTRPIYALHQVLVTSIITNRTIVIHSVIPSIIRDEWKRRW